MTDLDDTAAVDDEDKGEPVVESPSRSRWGTRPGAGTGGSSSEPAQGAPYGSPNLTEVRVITQQAVIDENGVRPLRALVVHPRLAAWIFGSIFLLGLVYGVTAETQYEAEVDLIAGRLDASVEAIPALVPANEQLAQNYSRLLSDPMLVADIADESELSVSQVRDRVSATQLASSPFIRVSGSGPTADDARVLTEITGRLLMQYANDFASVSTDPDELLRQFDEAVVALNAARADVRRAESALGDDLTDSERSVEEENLTDAQTSVDQLTFRVQALENEYLEARRATASEGLVRPASDVEDRGSNRLGNLSLGLAIGLLGGIVVAIGFVTLIELVRFAQSEPVRTGEAV